MPNPSVGAVIVYNSKIIGEGFTASYGGNHAEVNAINAVKNKSLLPNSTLYVSLEPCSHHGKTPPCCELISKHNIGKVVIGCLDTNPKVSGKGIEHLQKHGCEVITSVLESECRSVNHRFFTFHEKQRPYIILKWAQTSDGFIDNNRTDNSTPPLSITDSQCNTLVHYWRSEEMAILVGKNTALLDNPSLTTRLVEGQNPLRIVLSPSGELTSDLKLIADKQPTLVFTIKPIKQDGNFEFVQVSQTNYLTNVLNELYKRNILSILVEGGTQTHQHFIDNNLWDEARVFTNNSLAINNGVTAPIIDGNQDESLVFDNITLSTYNNA